MASYAITAIGSDQPGIVAAVTAVLFELNCNIEDSQMTILRGHFAMMLVVSAPSGVDEDKLDAALDPVADQLGLEAVVARKVDELAPERQRPDHVLTVYGADHPGIVAAVAKPLAALGVNITDMNTRLVGESDNPLYAMMLELSVPTGLADDRLQEALAAVGREAKVEVSLRTRGADTL